MAEQAAYSAARVAQEPAPAARRRATLDLKRQYGFGTIAIFCLVALYAPILVLFVFSFNETRSVAVWSSFSLDWYVKAFANVGMRDAAITTLQVGFVATIGATIIATAAALATTRTRPWRGMMASYMVINLPLMVPEIVTAIATLMFFALIAGTIGFKFGIGNLMLAHMVFCIPFAYMPIRARLEDMDLTLEQAASDLYATPWQAFRRVTLPLLMPGVVSGATLAFVVSFDDFTITSFVAGPGQTTLPIYIWTSLRRGISPEINAMSSILLGASILLVSLSFLIGRRHR
jgi:ABC-type spermidine/putrescine transport system permease subunit II